MKVMEKWKDIEGYEGLYEVSNLGRVRSLPKKTRSGVRILTPGITYSGYLYVVLCKNGKTKTFSVHRLVAKAFLPNPDNLPCINHKSEIKSQNYVWVNEDGSIDPEKSSLEWCNVAYNNNYGTHNHKISAKMTNGKLSTPVKQMNLDGTLVTIWPSINEAQRNGFDTSGVWGCCNGKYSKYKGFKWAYL